MTKYIRQEHEVEAVQWNGSTPDNERRWVRSKGGYLFYIWGGMGWHVTVKTPCGPVKIEPDWWIIYDDGIFNVCNPEDFSKRYRPVEELLTFDDVKARAQANAFGIPVERYIMEGIIHFEESEDD